MSQVDDPETAVALAAVLFRPAEEGGAWWVLHTRPRCEKRALQVCLDCEVRHYLPTRWSTPKGSGRGGQRRYRFEVPLFPGYVFGCCNPEQRRSLLYSGVLVRTIPVVDQQELLDELSSIYLAIHQGAELALYPQLKRGRRVRVVRGPLAGLRGRISGRRAGFRLVLNVTILGTAVAAEIDMADVEPVGR
jgi:transcription antitermination factor NusG